MRNIFSIRFLLLLFGALLLVSNQNCSKAAFSDRGTDSASGIEIDLGDDDQVGLDGNGGDGKDGTADGTGDGGMTDGDGSGNDGTSGNDGSAGNDGSGNNGGGNGHDGSSNNGSGNGSDNGSGNGSSGHSQKCKNIEVKDVILNVKEISLENGKSVFSGPGKVLMSELESGYKLKSNISTRSNQLRLVLYADGNKIINNSDNIEFDLKTPSAQQSGLKLNAKSKCDFEKDKEYLIKVEFDPDTQIVEAGKKCLLKPVLNLISCSEVK